MTAKKKNPSSSQITNLDPKSNETKKSSNDNERLHDVELELELTVAQLHQTQEDLEQATYTLIKNSNRINELSNRIFQLIQGNLDFWEADSIEAKLVKNTKSAKVIQWKAINSYLGNSLHHRISFTTSYTAGITAIIFQREETSDFTYFQANEARQDLTCLPVQGAFTNQNNATLSALGTSDWKALNLLIPKIARILRNEIIHDIPKELAAQTIDGLVKLQSILEGWPNLLRYDSIKLANTVNTSEYQALDFHIENLEIGSQSLKTFCYRLSSVNETDKAFGQYPRLEFHENSKDSFENWFVESEDERGKRLELRFADPDQMDIGVWRKVADRDRLLIVAIISKLPEMLKALRETNENRARWVDWINIANMMKATLITTTNDK